MKNAMLDKKTKKTLKKAGLSDAEIEAHEAEDVTKSLLDFYCEKLSGIFSKKIVWQISNNSLYFYVQKNARNYLLNVNAEKIFIDFEYVKVEIERDLHRLYFL